MPVFLWLWCALVLTAAPLALEAQWPGEIRGVVTDGITGEPVVAAEIRLQPDGLLGVASSDGAFWLRGLQPGSATLRVSALGYSTEVINVVVLNGTTVHVAVVLQANALELAGITASVSSVPRGGFTVDASRIRAAGAATVADALQGVPGVLIVTTNPGGPQTPTIRGSGTDAVLVLVDGVPINDPVTGQADLSALPAASVQSITVLSGGQSARYGARAEAGVILIRSGPLKTGARATIGAGMLGERWGESGASWGVIGGELDAHASYREHEGAFDFAVSEQLGSGAGTVSNADLRAWSGRIGWTSDGTDEPSTVGISVEDVARGMPGRSFAPSPSARQQLRQARLFATTSRRLAARTIARASGYLQRHRTRFRDPDPPFGQPFDDVTTLGGGGADASISGSLRYGTLGLGVAGRYLGVESSALSGAGVLRRTDLGVWMTASSTTEPLAVSATARVDRGGLPASTFWSHDMGLRSTVGPAAVSVGHRSSYSPPSLGDQFFREGVGVEANPDLVAERVPAEWVVGADAWTTLGSVEVSVGGEGYVGDVEGMILWLPDFRFVWSPRNHDIKRRGLELRGEVSAPILGLKAWGGWSLNRTTYDRPDSPDVQVAYRPRYSGRLGTSVARPSWSTHIEARYTGARFPVPNDVNELPSFWTTKIAASRSWSLGPTTLDLQVEVDRLFNREEALIFAFPHPGRTVRVSVQLRG